MSASANDAPLDARDRADRCRDDPASAVSARNGRDHGGGAAADDRERCDDVIARLIGDTPPNLGAGPRLCAGRIETPLGPMIALADDHGLHLLEFWDRAALPKEAAETEARTGAAIREGRTAPIVEVERELADYFAGRAALFRTPLVPGGTPFQRTVWQALVAIPTGRTVAYRDLARAAGRPGSVRAAAGANGANRFAILVPCHRVVGADGSLTGYAGGLWRKRWLIDHERRMTAEAGQGGGRA